MSYLGVSTTDNNSDIAASAAALVAAQNAASLTLADASRMFQAKAPPVTWYDFNPPNAAVIVLPIPGDGTPANVCINNPALLASLVLAFPVTGTPDGQVIRITARSAVTALATNAATGGLLQGAMTSLVAGGGGCYQFRASNSTWYRF